MNARNWIRIWASVIVISITSISATNYLIDPYYVFHKEDKYYIGHSNIGFIKIEHLKEKKMNITLI